MGAYFNLRISKEENNIFISWSSSDKVCDRKYDLTKMLGAGIAEEIYKESTENSETILRVYDSLFAKRRNYYEYEKHKSSD